MDFTIIVSVVWTLVLLSLLIVIHEFGHFLAAKFLGVHVEEFAVGFPPRVKKLFTWWNTPFVLNSIPIGGYVRLFGDDSETVEEVNEVERQQGVTDAQAFRFKPIWARLIILLAGVFVNFVFGIFCFTLIYSYTGIPQRTEFPVVLTEISAGSPAEDASLQVGDRIQRAGETLETSSPVVSSDDLIARIAAAQDNDIFLVYERAGEVIEQNVRLRESETARLGVVLKDDIRFEFYPWWQMPARATVVGVQDSFALIGLILDSLGTMVGNIFTSGTVPTDLKGPIGIIEETHKSGILASGWTGSVNWLGLISINLAVMNLLPLPVLDGGRSLFLLSEPFIGRARRLRWEQRANGVGMLFLLGLFVLISASDVWGLFR